MVNSEWAETFVNQTWLRSQSLTAKGPEAAKKTKSPAAKSAEDAKVYLSV